MRSNASKTAGVFQVAHIHGKHGKLLFGGCVQSVSNPSGSVKVHCATLALCLNQLANALLPITHEVVNGQCAVGCVLGGEV